MRLDRMIVAVLSTFISFALIASSAAALPLVGIDDGQIYQLADHPDGNAAPPTYGLRLDGLYGGGGSEVNTFSFETGDASMFLGYQNDTLTIFGVMQENVTGHHWDISMTYAMSPTLIDGKLGSTGPEGSNVGVMTNQTTQMVVTLEDFMPVTFFLGYDHRGFAGISGWGWVNHSGAEEHVSSSDWLFTVVPNRPPPVPEPSSAITFAAGSVLIAGALRRRPKNRK